MPDQWDGVIEQKGLFIRHALGMTHSCQSAIRKFDAA